MPWLDQVAGRAGSLVSGHGRRRGDRGNLLFGRVNPSGHLPVSFPRDESQLPRRAVDGIGNRPEQPIEVNYSRRRRGRLSLVSTRAGSSRSSRSATASPTPTSTMAGSAPRMRGGELTVSFTVRNTGRVAGKRGAANLCRPRGRRLGSAQAARRLRQAAARARRAAARHARRRSAAAGHVPRAGNGMSRPAPIGSCSAPRRATSARR